MLILRFLVSEDDEYKYDKICKCIGNVFSNYEITRCSSVRATLKTLKEDSFHYLIQDMNMPIFEDDFTIRSEAGMQVLADVFYKNISIPYKFVCSSDPCVGEDYEEEFNEYGVSFIHFNPVSTSNIEKALKEG